MGDKQNVFPLEHRLQELFDAVYPTVPGASAKHPTGRAFRPIFDTTLGSMVPGGPNARKLQGEREYYKLDYEDFLEYATSELPTKPRLQDLPDQTAIFYDSLTPGTDFRDVHATWTTPNGTFGLSVLDSVVARDGVFVSVLMRFAGLSFAGVLPSSDGSFDKGKTMEAGEGRIAECGATITFVPGRLEKKEGELEPLGEWERAFWYPADPIHPEWQFFNSGEYTSYLIEELEKEENPPLSREILALLRERREQNHTDYGVHFELARLGLLLPGYVDFMYDLVVHERRKVGSKKKRWVDKKGTTRVSERPLYKIISSIRIIRPEERSHSGIRQWTAPTYSFLVHGHWRNFADPEQKGPDSEGNAVYGKTWVRDFWKYKNSGDTTGLRDGEVKRRDPRVTIGVKQTLAYARDVIQSFEQKQDHQCSDTERPEEPSAEWMATERAKLTAGLRYLVMKRDGFRCYICGKRATDENYVKLEVDHVIPILKWGRTVEENLRTLCRDCNRGKSTH